MRDSLNNEPEKLVVEEERISAWNLQSNLCLAKYTYRTTRKPICQLHIQSEFCRWKHTQMLDRNQRWHWAYTDVNKGIKGDIGHTDVNKGIKGDIGHTQMLDRNQRWHWAYTDVTKESKVTLGIYRCYKGIKGDTGNEHRLRKSEFSKYVIIWGENKTSRKARMVLKLITLVMT
jgi:hypothetical protein